MAIHYSASTGGFHDASLGELPADARPVSAERHARLLAAQAAGHAIVPGRSGFPRLDRLASDALEARRDRAIAAVAAEAERRVLLVAPVARQLEDLRALVTAIYRANETGLVQHIADDVDQRAKRIDRVRRAQTVLRARVDTLSRAELNAFDATLDQHWSAA